VEVGPDECDVHDVFYPCIVIRKEDGTFQEFAPVRAVYEVAGLIEANASGHFIFWQRPTECLLAFFYSDRGARAVDFDACASIWNKPLLFTGSAHGRIGRRFTEPLRSRAGCVHARRA